MKTITPRGTAKISQEDGRLVVTPVSGQVVVIVIGGGGPQVWGHHPMAGGWYLENEHFPGQEEGGSHEM